MYELVVLVYGLYIYSAVYITSTSRVLDLVCIICIRDRVYELYELVEGSHCVILYMMYFW